MSVRGGNRSRANDPQHYRVASHSVTPDQINNTNVSINRRSIRAYKKNVPSHKQAICKCVKLSVKLLYFDEIFLFMWQFDF